MVPIPTNKGSLFIQLRREFAKMIKVSSPGIVLQSILRGDNLLRIMRNLLKTLDRDCTKHISGQAANAPSDGVSSSTNAAGSACVQRLNQNEAEGGSASSQSETPFTQWDFVKELAFIALTC